MDCRRDLTIKEMEAAIAKGLHVLAQDPGAAVQFQKEALDKARHRFCKIVWWANIRDDPHMNLKISLIAAVLH